MGHPAVGVDETQIPFEDDNKKSKDKSQKQIPCEDDNQKGTANLSIREETPRNINLSISDDCRTRSANRGISSKGRLSTE